MSCGFTGELVERTWMGAVIVRPSLQVQPSFPELDGIANQI